MSFLIELPSCILTILNDSPWLWRPLPFLQKIQEKQFQLNNFVIATILYDGGDEEAMFVFRRGVLTRNTSQFYVETYDLFLSAQQILFLKNDYL